MRKLFRFAIVAVLVVAAWQIFSDGYTKQPADETDQVAVPVPSEQTVDPPVIASDKRSITVALEDFASAYYRRDETLFGAGFDQAEMRFRERLASLVTPAFLDSYVPRLDIPQNQGFATGRYRQTGHLGQLQVGGEFDDSTAHVTAAIRIAVRQDHRIIHARTVATDFALEQRDGVWKVAACSCDS